MNNTIPEKWQKVLISDVSEKSQYGYTTKAVDEGQVHLLRTTDITKGKITWDTVPFCKTPPIDLEKYQLEIGDVLISRAGSVGESYLIKSLPEKSTVFASYLIRFKPTINAKYFKYFLNSPEYWNAITENQSGIAVPNVNATKLNAIELPLPPNEIQQRIVEKIEELFSELDHGVESLKKAQKQLKTYRQAVLKDAFEGKLTKEWREQQNDLPTPEELLEQIKAEREAHRERELAEWEQEVEQWERDGKKGRKPRKPRKLDEYDQFTERQLDNLSEIPDSWLWMKVGNICPSIVPNRDKPKSFSGDIPWLTTPDIDPNKISIDLSKVGHGLTSNEVEKYNARMIPPESVIMTCVGSFGVVCVNKIRCVCNQQLHAFITDNLINPCYLAYALKEKKSWMEKEATSTTVSYLNKTKSNSIPIPLCSEKEQQEIVNEIESRLSVVDQLEQTINENLQKAEALRQSILKKAFRGDLVEG